MPVCWFCKREVVPPYQMIILMNTEGVYDFRLDYICRECNDLRAMAVKDVGLN